MDADLLPSEGQELTQRLCYCYCAVDCAVPAYRDALPVALSLGPRQELADAASGSRTLIRLLSWSSTYSVILEELTCYRHPQTCDNTLELPHYWKALCWQSAHDEGADSEQLEAALGDLLTNKLRTAVEYSEGYGLDATSSVAGVMLPGMRLASLGGDEDAIEKEESYESLDLPALQSGEDGDTTDKATAGAASSNASRDLAEEGSVLDKAPPTTTSTSDATAAGDDDHKDGDGEKETKAEAAGLASPAGADRKEESYEEYDDWEEEEAAE